MDVVVWTLAGVAVGVAVVAWLLLRRVRTLRKELVTVTRERSQMVDSVRRAERDRDQLLQAVDGLPVGVIAIDDAGVVVFANDAASRFVNARHGDAVVEVAIRRIAALATSDARVVEEEIEVYASGNRYLGIRAVPVAGVDEVAALVFVEDRTQQHRVDVIRRDFVANVSHELRTPLGALSLLADTLADETDPEVRTRLIGRIGEEAARMGRLVDDVLDLSQVEADVAVGEPVSLTAVVRAGARSATAADDTGGVELKIVAPADEVLVSGDRAQLESMVRNLVDNAVKYTAAAGRSGGGTVLVELRRSGDHATLVVVDEGIGIGPEHLDRIFERFYRIDRGRRRHTGGTGLGLAIVRHVVRNHGGEITVQSTPGTGSVFTVRLPLIGSAPLGAGPGR